METINILRIAKILWFILCLAVVLWTFQIGGDGRLIAFYILGIVALPSSIILLIFASGIGSQISFDGLISGIGIDFVFCVVTIFVGYLQWFVLLPRLYKRVKSEKSLAIWLLLLVSFTAIFYGCYRFYHLVFPGG